MEQVFIWVAMLASIIMPDGSEMKLNFTKAAFPTEEICMAEIKLTTEFYAEMYEPGDMVSVFTCEKTPFYSGLIPTGDE